MKVLCPSCERLIDLERFKLDGSTLVVTCQRCEAATRVEAPVVTPVVMPVPVAVVSPLPVHAARVTLSSAGASNVVVLRTAATEAVTKARAAADAGPFTIPEDVCPKCIARRGTAAECPHCGVRYETFDEASALPPTWLQTQWVSLLRDWGNESAHQTVRRKAQQADALAAIGRLYRLRQAAVPDDPVTAEGLADVLRLAAVSMASTNDPAATEGRRTLALLFSVVLFIALSAALYFFLRGTPPA